MKITSIDYYRDCSTTGVIVEVDGNSTEYLIHGSNWGNNRFDVTVGGWSVQAYPCIRDLKELEAALADFEYSEQYTGWQKTSDQIEHLTKDAHALSGMVRVFRHWLENTENPPAGYPVQPPEDIEAIVVDRLSKELSEIMEQEALNNLEKTYEAQ